MSNRKLYWVLLLLSVCQIGAAQGLSPTTPAKEYIRFNGQVVAVENALPVTGGLTNQPGLEKAQAVWASSRPTLSLFPASPSTQEHSRTVSSFSLQNRSRALLLTDLPILSRSHHEQTFLLLTRSWLTLLRSSSPSTNPPSVHMP